MRKIAFKKGIVFLGVFLLVVSQIFSIYSTSTAHAQISAAAKAVAKAKPAAVLVVTIVSALITYPSVQQIFIQLDLPYPTPVQTTVFGSGFIVNPEGYIITNGHVVNSWNNDLARVGSLLKNFVNILSYAYEKTGLFVKSPLNETVSAYQNGTLLVKEYTVQVKVGTGAVVSGLDNVGKLFDAQIIATKPAESWDLALIKVTKSNMPTVKIGDSSKLSVNDVIYAIGYPGAVAPSAFLSQKTALDPVVTSGAVSAFRQTSDGTPAIQTDATITFGNSGGMVFNESGEVIGVTTFSTPSDIPGVLVPGFNFLRPSSLVSTLLSQNGVSNTQSATDTAFAEALELYWAKHYKASIQKFQEVLMLYPGHPDAQKYITDAQAAVARGEDVPVWFDIMTIGIIVGVVTAVVVIMVTLLLKMRKPTRKPAPVARHKKARPSKR